MKLKAMLALISLPLAAFAAAGLDAPQGLTLSVDAAESGMLVWDPINRDDLMGYSVWMRQDKGEFTRLNIPTLVGKELKKLPMTAKSFLALKGIGKRTVELMVVAEYESGRSEPSLPVFSKKARRPRAESAGETPQPLTSTAKPPAAATDDEEKAPAPRPVSRPLMAPQGSFHSSLNFAFLYEQTAAKGYNSMGELGYVIVDDPNFDYSRPENWTITYPRRSIRVPLSLEYGFLSALEIGGDIAWIQERAYAGKFDFGTQTFGSYQSEAAMEASGFGNPAVKVKLQPLPSAPLRLSLRATLPSGGRSRLQAFGEYLFRASRVAGLDDNAQRLEIKAEYGEPTNEPGLSCSLGLIPAASETAVADIGFGRREKHRVERGQEIFGQIGYRLPWKAESMPGSLTAGLGLRSIDPGRWLIDDVDIGDLLSKDQRAELRSFTGVNLGREDQFEIFVELIQNLYNFTDRYGKVSHAVDSGGRFSLILKPDGWIFGASGGFYY